MNLQTLRILLLTIIVLLGGFFNKVIPLNLTILFACLLAIVNITRKAPQTYTMYLYALFAFLFLITPFHYEPIDLRFPGYKLTSKAKCYFSIIVTFFRTFGYLVLAYSVSVIPFKENHFRYIWNSLIITGLLVALFCVLEYYFGIKFKDYDQVDIIMKNVFRVRGPFGDPNASAGMILPGIIIAFSFLIFKKNNVIFLLSIISFLFFGMATTASRTALVALVCSLMLFVFIKSHILPSWKKITILLLLGVVGSFALLFYLKERVVSFDADSSASVRLLLVWSGIELMLDHPFFGHGLVGGFHNIFIDIGVSGGIPLLLLFVCLLSFILFYLWKNRNQMNAYIIMGLLLSFIIVGLGITWLSNVVFWVVIGLGMNKYYRLNTN